LQIALSIAFPIYVVRRDLARLSSEHLTRAWNDASLWSAAAAFGPLCLVVYFSRTRRSLAGFAVGVLWALGGLTLSSGLALCLEP
jgi:hypothetical protein